MFLSIVFVMMSNFIQCQIMNNKEVQQLVGKREYIGQTEDGGEHYIFPDKLAEANKMKIGIVISEFKNSQYDKETHKYYNMILGSWIVSCKSNKLGNMTNIYSSEEGVVKNITNDEIDVIFSMSYPQNHFEKLLIENICKY